MAQIGSLGMLCPLSRRLAGVLFWSLVVWLLASCSGGTFHLDSSLSQTPPLPISGKLGFNTVNCAPTKGAQAKSAAASRAEWKQHEKALKAKSPGLAGDKAAKVVVGPLTGLASAPHRHLENDLVFDKAALHDYERFLDYVHDPASLRDVKSALASFTGSQDSRHFPKDIEALLQSVHGLLRLPRTTTETMTFTFFARRGGHTIAAACLSSDTARFLGFFDPPHFFMICRIVPAVDGVSRELSVRGSGNWADYGFLGRLSSAHGETARFSSQNVSVLGMGSIRGFDLKSPGADQIGALSFWQVLGPGGQAEPRAWMAGVRPSGWSDAVLTTLALAYVFPWPSGCDTQHIRAQGVERALDAP